MMQTEDSSSIQVIARAIAVMKACNALGPGLSLGEIAKHVGLPRSTVQRIVQSLTEGGFLVSQGRSRTIALGPDLLAMGANATNNFFELAHPYLKALAEETGETVDLARFNRNHMVFIDQVAGAHRLRAVSSVGDIFPLHCTANGKAALALLDDENLLAVLKGELTAFTPNTITEPETLRAKIEQLRSGTVAVDNEEHSLGICAIGSGFTDAARQIYAVSIPIPAVRFADKRPKCEPLLLSAVRSIERALGLRPR
jgi:IclR family acetate operon transcriptional repressor